jgi:hypothetical protein
MERIRMDDANEMESKDGQQADDAGAKLRREISTSNLDDRPNPGGIRFIVGEGCHIEGNCSQHYRSRHPGPLRRPEGRHQGQSGDVKRLKGDEKMKNRALIGALFAMLSVSITSRVRGAPSGYTFTNVVVATSGLSNFSAPIINNDGQVLFGASDGVSKGFLLLAKPGNPMKTIVQADPTHLEFICGRSLNDSGIVAYSRCGTDVPVQGIYTSDGITTTTITERLLGQPGYDFSFPVGEPQINNDGTVVFSSGKDGHPGLFAAKNGQITTLLTVLTTPASQPGPQRLNDSGEVVFRHFRSSDNAEGLFSVNVNGGPVTPVVLEKDLGAGVVSIDNQFSLNNQGKVAFVIKRSGPPDIQDIGISDGNTTKILAHAERFGPLLTGVASPSINDNSEVVFFGSYHKNGQIAAGILTGPDIDQDRIIGSGDSLFGSTATGVAFDSQGLNDKGQIAFLYGLTDGTIGIAIATLTVPEPSTLGIVTVALMRAIVKCCGWH